MKDLDKNILVSIIVITYNSSKFIVETLESIRNQDYNNIELIISDDASTDLTVNICKEWLYKNKNLFSKMTIIGSPKNLGISVNCNRGFNLASGSWIKYIAGDDILHFQCIRNFIDYLLIEPSAKIVESATQYFNNSFEEKNFTKIHNLNQEFFFKDFMSSEMQYEMLLRKNFLHAPSVFLNRKVIEKVGKFDEDFKYIEDYPIWLKLTKLGIRIHFMNKVTVFYRLHVDSIFSGINEQKLFNNFYLKKRDFELKYIYPNISKLEKIFRNWEYYRFKTLDQLRLNNKNTFSRAINYITFKLSPYYFYNKLILKRLEKKYLKNAKT